MARVRITHRRCDVAGSPIQRRTSRRPQIIPTALSSVTREGPIESPASDCNAIRVH